jgi:hypothetical protein
VQRCGIEDRLGETLGQLGRTNVTFLSRQLTPEPTLANETRQASLRRGSARGYSRFRTDSYARAQRSF